MSTLILPTGSRPSNLRLPPELRYAQVDSDMYNICGRVAEISDRLYILLLQDEKGVQFQIMEQCEDGVDRQVMRVRELDGRVIDRLRYIMSVPLAQRMAELEQANAAFERAQKARIEDDLWERFGAPMLTQLHLDGFTDSRGKSYPIKRQRPRKRA